MPERSSAAIELRGVTRRFGNVVALEQVTLAIRPGELFFLLGPSGCGKTTLLRILAGLETPDAGTVLFHGQDTAGLPPHQRGAPMVFQNYALWPHLSVAENVAFGLVERRLSRAEIAHRVAEVLRRVGLADLGRRMPGQLSGGQQQRVVLARALVVNPQIILLDEPLSNLDAKLRVEMRSEIEALHAETDITFVYVTHDQTEALSLADRLAVMAAGRIVAVGTPAELYHRPPNRFCAEFLGEANLVPGRVVNVAANTAVVETQFGPWRALLVDTTPPPETGEPVWCLIRPEALEPVAGPLPGWNNFEAHVRSVRLTGATVSVGLQAAGRELRALRLAQLPFPVRPGARAWWAGPVERTVLIRSDERGNAP